MKINKVEDLQINDVIYPEGKIIIKDIDIIFFKYKGRKGEYAILEYDENKLLYVNPKHILNNKNGKLFIQFTL